MLFIKSGNKRSLWYHVRRANNPQSGMLKFWEVCKSTEFRASISLQPTGLQKNSLWAGSSYGGLLNPLFAALEATPETGVPRSPVACPPPREGQWRSRGSRGGRTLGWFMEKRSITKGYLLLRKVLLSIDGTQKQWAGTRSNGWVRGKEKGKPGLFQLETGWNARRRRIILPVSLKTLRAEVCSIWGTISTLQQCAAMSRFCLKFH